MNAEAILKKNTRFDHKGNPVEVVVPYGQFIDFIEEYGLDLTKEEGQAIREASEDLKAGRHEKFISSEEIKKEFGLA